MREYNILLAGVGGQGILLAAEALGTAASNEGFNVRVSEIHGMAQRGGAVTSAVRIGEDVRAPTMLEGRADVILGFEPLETLRNLHYCSDRTIVIMSTTQVPPTELAAKGAKYPSIDVVAEKIRRFTGRLVIVEADQIAQKAGSRQAQNSALLGVLASVADLPMKTDGLIQALRELVPQKHVDVNMRAFRLGLDEGRRCRGGRCSTP